MAKFIKGDIVVIPFPFSDLSSSKRRPALVLADLSGEDIILCQITSNVNNDKYGVKLVLEDLISGKLSVDSNIRPNRLFTADKNLILYTLGHINSTKYKEVINTIIDLVS